MITYDVEILREVRHEMEDLLKEHWEEIALNRDKIKLNPDWGQYELLEASGNIYFITCRDKGKLIGYSAWFIRNHLHYKDTVWALNDVIFLKKEYRRGRTGLGLIRMGEYMAKILGAQKCQWHVKVTNDWTPILKRLGYEMEEYVCGKYVG